MGCKGALIFEVRPILVEGSAEGKSIRGNFSQGQSRSEKNPQSLPEC